MDKVQVDARKLQLLNDRINQTIDALNQVRLTAQQAGLGISHTGLPQTAGYGLNPLQSALGAFPVANPYALQHSSFIDPYTQARQQWELAAMIGRGVIPSPIASSPFGLGHSSYIPRSPAAEVVFGAFDPIARQMEVARANEANRVWEWQHGLAHTSAYHPYASAGYGALPFVSQSPIGFSPTNSVIG